MAEKEQKVKGVGSFQHCGVKVEVHQYDVEQEVKIEGKTLAYQRDADTGAYVCSDSPYRAFGTLQELAAAVIDDRQASNGDGNQRVTEN